MTVFHVETWRGETAVWFNTVILQPSFLNGSGWSGLLQALYCSIDASSSAEYLFIQLLDSLLLFHIIRFRCPSKNYGSGLGQNKRRCPYNFSALVATKMGCHVWGILSPMPWQDLRKSQQEVRELRLLHFHVGLLTPDLLQKQELRPLRFQTLWGCVRSQVLPCSCVWIHFCAFIRLIWSKQPLCPLSTACFLWVV